MKKIMMSVVLAAACAALFAQTEPTFELEKWGPQSLESYITAGTFINEIDEAFIPGTDFGSYEQQFIYGGLGNPNAGAGNGVGPNSDDKGGQFGYYRPGKLPMSFYIDFSANAFFPRPTGKTTKTWNNLQHEQLEKTEKESYNKVPAFRTYNGNLRFLTAFGTGMRFVTGLYFKLNGDNRNYDKDHFLKTETIDHLDSSKNKTESRVNLNTAPAAPGSLTYKTPIRGTNSFTDIFTIGVPLAFKTGDLAHTATLEIKGKLTNKNASYKLNENAKTVSFSHTGYESNVLLLAGYAVEIPAKYREQDKWLAKGRIGYRFKNEESKHEYTSSQNNVKAKYSDSRLPNLGFGLAAKGGRLFVFPSPKKSIIFRLQPAFGFSLETEMDGNSGYNPKIQASYSDNSQSLSYTKVDKSGNWKNKTTFKTELEVPMGIKILPENWKIGFLFGAKINATWEISATWDRSENHKKVIIETETNKPPKKQPPYEKRTSKDEADITLNKIEVKETHYIGFTIPFEGGAHVDFNIQGSNLNVINSFRLQAFIPLGTPKSKK